MKIILTFLIFIHLVSSTLYGQSFDFDFGARSAGMGNSNSNLTDEWSLFNNVGGISTVENGTIFFGYHQFFGIEGFNKVAAGAIHPFTFGNLGLSFLRFGDELFSEQTASAAFGNKIGFVRLGLRANYYQLRIDEYGTSSTLYFDLGGVVELIPKLSFGAYISNFTISTLNNSEKSKLPVIMKLGFSYKPAKGILMNLDLYKDVDYNPILKAGIEYLIKEKVYIRTGINTEPLKGFFGLGIILNRFKIDYAVGTSQFLGTFHQATISFIYWNTHED